MARFQVITLRPYAGVSKAGNSYTSLTVGGITTNDDGTVVLGEDFFMASDRYPLPKNLVIGSSYTLVHGVRVRDGKNVHTLLGYTPVSKAV
jgi:hypothetical protein